MALIGSGLASEVGLRVLFSPLGSNIVLRTACCSVGIGLPVYSTFKAIENRDQNEQHKWLVYWAAYGSFSLVEVFTDKLISWFPLYYHVKFAFLVWLQLPTVDVKVIRSHQGEIRFVRSMFVKLLGSSVNEVASPSQRQGEISNTSPEPESESDHED
ncbi:hypothetical protein Bca4012_015740 [Brassica carinata]